MRRPIGTAITASLPGAAALLAAPGTVAAADCGRLSGGSRKTKGAVDCGKARRIVKEFLRVRKPAIQGYRCKGGLAKVVCTLDEKRITWKRA